VRLRRAFALGPESALRGAQLVRETGMAKRLPGEEWNARAFWLGGQSVLPLLIGGARGTPGD